MGWGGGAIYNFSPRAPTLSLIIDISQIAKTFGEADGLVTTGQEAGFKQKVWGNYFNYVSFWIIRIITCKHPELHQRAPVILLKANFYASFLLDNNNIVIVFCH